MALFHQVRCQYCDTVYSSIHKKCPNCGTKQGAASADSSGLGAELIAGIVVLVAIVLVTVIFLTKTLKNAEPEATKPPKATAAAEVTTTPTPSQEPEVSPSADPESDAEPSEEPAVEPSTAPSVSDIALNREDFTLGTIGETFQLTAALYPADSTAGIIWISEDENVATVDANGLVTAVDHGSTVISATAGGFTKECIVRVSAYAPAKTETPAVETAQPSAPAVETEKPASSSAVLSHSDVTLRTGSESDRSFTLKVTGTAAGASVSFSSQDRAVATVSENGLVTAAGKGSTSIIVTVKDADGSETALSCIIRVIS